MEQRRSILLFSLVCVVLLATLAPLALQQSISSTFSYGRHIEDLLTLSSIFKDAPKVYPSDPNLPSFAFARFTKKGQGFFNQQMAFSGAMMLLVDHMVDRGSFQVVLPSLIFLDYLGTDKLIRFDRLFDVDHWNSYFPRLPRIVSYNETQHFQYIVKTSAVVPNQTAYNHPFYLESAGLGFRTYNAGYMRSLESGSRTELHPVDKLILQGALRPAPAVQAEIWRSVQDGNFAAIHLRFEQDYLCHGFPLKVRNLTQTLAHIEKSLGPDPPFDRVYFAVNRPLLEDATNMPANPKPSAEVCEIERQDNLATLNRAVRDGMWGGRVRVFERPPLERQFRDRPMIFGSFIDSEICLNAKVFLGRFSSTFTKNIIRRRSVMGFNESYDYESGFRKMFWMTVPASVEDKSK
eukprot:scaffold2992_cov214-Amphora_coffeaeformis.AAC.15